MGLFTVTGQLGCTYLQHLFLAHSHFPFFFIFLLGAKNHKQKKRCRYLLRKIKFLF